MRKPTISTTLLGATAGLILASSVTAQAAGKPHRSSTPPPGLTKVFARQVSGILRAIVATQGSNSRLQDLPVSP